MYIFIKYDFLLKLFDKADIINNIDLTDFHSFEGYRFISNSNIEYNGMNLAQITNSKGLKATPQNAAGCLTDPPVSDPKAIRTYPAATAAADPPELPPGTRLLSIGFTVGPKAEFSVDEPIPNSSKFVLPAIKPPARRSLCTTVAS